MRAYAKINLGLHILGKRLDGYHDLETVFLRVNISDTLTFERADGLTLSCDKPDVPVDNTNLCLRAAQLLREHCSIAQGVRITLRKKIPIGAGLGGGSSDAAATLLGLSSFWNIPLDNPKLRNLAAMLGSDVPFFLQPGAAYATGRGEALEPMALTLPYWIAVVYPKIMISTAWAYAHLRLKEKTIRSGLQRTVVENLHNPQQLMKSVRNDFEPVVFEQYPAVREVRDSLLYLGAEFAQLSGSGSAVYGLFRTEPDLDKFSYEFPPRYEIFLTRPNFEPKP